MVFIDAVCTSIVTLTLQVDALAGLVDDQLAQHRRGFKQSEAIAHDDSGLLTIGSDHHDGAALTGTEVFTPVFEGRPNRQQLLRG